MEMGGGGVFPLHSPTLRITPSATAKKQGDAARASTMSRPLPDEGKSQYRNIYRDQFVCYSNRRCDRPAHMRTRSLTEPWYIRGHIVDSTEDGVCLDPTYNEFPWQGICAYLEIDHPGIYVFATPCDCGDGSGSITDEPSDINERVCVWQGERCAGMFDPALPPRPPASPPSPSPPPSPPKQPPPPTPPPAEDGLSPVGTLGVAFAGVVGAGALVGLVYNGLPALMRS